MTPTEAKTLKRGEKVLWKEYGDEIVTVQAVGRHGNGVRIWRADRQIPGRVVTDMVLSSDLHRISGNDQA